jgi:hypothetical protein
MSAPSPAIALSFPVAVVSRSLPILAATTALALLVYASVQQAHRSAANDPQIQIAEDAAHRLAAGENAATLVTGAPVDLAKSLGAWMIVLDRSDHVVASNAVLEGRTPTLPAGVLATARRQGEDRVTWMPRRSARSATVAVAVPGGDGRVVVVGRSLREVEEREGRLEQMAGAAWAAACIAVLIAAAAGLWLGRGA